MIQYHNLLRQILETGTQKTDRTGTGTRSVFAPQMRFNLKDGFPLLTTKKLHVKSIIHELLWILSGDTNIKYLVDNGVNIWNDWPLKEYNEVHLKSPMTTGEFSEAIKNKQHFAGLWGDLGPVYGKQWREWSGNVTGVSTNGQLQQTPIDQLQQLIDTLKKTPDSRRMVVSAWNVGDLPAMALSPCHCLFQFYTEPLTYYERLESIGRINEVSSTRQSTLEELLLTENAPKYRLSCQLYQRSADVFLGVPFNIASYALLTQMVAQVVNMVPGEFIWTGGDTHLYLNHLQQAELQLTREPYALPTMRLNPDVKDLFAFKYEDFTLENYHFHPAIKASVSV